MRQHWIPIFEQNGLKVAMENHVHSFKKTFPLKQGQVVSEEEGITYIGDGSWAVILDSCKDPPQDIINLFEIWELKYHVWIVTIDLPNNSS